MKQKYYIDLHKGATFIYILLLMYFFSDCLSNKSNNNIAIYVYLALHGTYGILWILKSKIYPDKQWESKCSVWYGLLIWVGLSLYWIAPYIILTKNIPNNTMSINFELEDVDLSFSHGGGSVSIDDISKNKNKKFKKFKYKINKKAFQYLSPCSFDKKHTYRWYAYAIDDWDNVLGEIAISEKKYP